MQGGPPINSGSVVEVREIPSGEARKVLNKPTIMMGNLVTMSVLVVFLGSILGVFAGVYISNLVPSFRHSQMMPLTTALGIVVAAVCLPVFVLSAYVGTKNSGAAGNRYYRSRARSAIALRLDKWVDPE